MPLFLRALYAALSTGLTLLLILGSIYLAIPPSLIPSFTPQCILALSMSTMVLLCGINLGIAFSQRGKMWKITPLTIFDWYVGH